MAEKSVYVVSAHAADYCTRAGGTIARYTAAGWKVRILVLTEGARGESGGYWKNNPGGTEEECAAVRRKESELAAERLQVTDISFLGLKDYPLTITADTIRLITSEILKWRPQLILTHWLEDPLNVDHEITAKAVVRALSSGAQLGAFPNTPAHYFPALYCFESTVPHSEFNAFRPDTYIDIDETFETKMAAIGAFACQPQLVGYYTHFAMHRGFQAADWAKRAIRYAEAFKRYIPHVGTTFPLTER